VNATKILGTLLVALSLFSKASSAKTIPYPGEFPTLDAAVQAASAGDTVLVAPGTYQESVRMKSAVVLRSSAGRDSTTLVSPGNAPDPLKERVIECIGVDSTTVIQGFTIDHGKSYGLAFYCENSKPSIRDNLIRGFGWGMHLKHSPAYIADNIVENCTAFGLLIMGCSPTVHRNEFRNNTGFAIDISGNHSQPEIGGSAENANKLYGNAGAVRISGRKDVVAHWNDWGWETTEEMKKEGYPSDIIAFMDGNDFGKSHRGRGKLDYRNWITASTAKVAAVASAPESASSVENKEEKRSYLPLGLSGVVIVILVALAARRRRANARP
jgi:hypothetical protein